MAVTATNTDGSGSAGSAQTAVVAAAPAPPVNGSPPSISGTAQAGQVLTAAPGSWTGTQPISYGYQWRRCDSAGANCADIAGATGQTYTLASADVGSTARVAVTATNTDGSGSAGSAQTAVVAAAPAPPVNGSPPSISGTAQAGQVLTAAPGSWTGTQPISYGYQWRRCDSAGANCVDIVGATAQTYTLASADVGSTVRVSVSATNTAGSGSAGSAQTAVVAAAPAPPVNSSPPTISGTARAGQVLTAAAGSWTGTQPISYGYQWRRCDSAGANCVDIVGAATQTYTLSSADVGSTARVNVSATNTAGSGSAGSAQTAVVAAAPAPPVNSSPPAISGTSQEGKVLTAAPGSWTGTQPISYSYQWRRCDSAGANCFDIVGAAAQTYTLASADVGSTVRVAVKATNTDGQTTVVSGQTSYVVAAGSVGVRDQAFTGAGDTAPSGSKPESKLWWNDGSWWADMWSTAANNHHIFKLSADHQTWVDTGVQLDDRAGTRSDALWDGTHLYVASHVFSECGCSTSSPGHPARLYRYSYNASTKNYLLDAGFPVAINDTSSETLAIDKDSTGTIWATWAQDNKVEVAHTVGSDSIWTTPFVLPVSGADTLYTDDLSSVVAFGGNKIGIMWSNQTVSAMYFSVHVDGQADTSWSVSRNAVPGPNYADDHINLKSLQADGSGRVFAAVKTSLNDLPNPNPNAPLIMLLVRDPASGDWSNYIFGRISDDHTRPIVILDEQNNVIHMFATAGVDGGNIYEKTSPLNAISFPTGRGTPFVKDAANATMNNATSTKQNVNNATGLVVLATNSATGYYWHNYKALP